MNPTIADAPPQATNQEFQTEQILTIAGGHFAHDTFSAFLAPLLPKIQAQLATNYALTGSLSIFAQLPSILNPFIGYLADKISLRYFIILAPGVTATLMTLIGIMPSYASLALLLLASGVSIAAFHAPAPAMVGRVSGDKIGRGMSIFMASGELGRALGPVLVAAGVEYFGLGGIWRLAIIGWLVSLILYLRLRTVPARTGINVQQGWGEFASQGRLFFSLMGLLLLTRVFLTVPITVYLPIFMTDVAQADFVVSSRALTILEAAGVVGALLAGTISDRLGRLTVLGWLTLIAPLLLIGFLYAPAWMAVPLLLLIGFCSLSPTPVILAMVQDEFPGNRALANGLAIGLNFLTRAFATWAVGALSDQWGLVGAFLFSAIFSLLGLFVIFGFSRRQRRAQTI